jgi:hypothetical protein
MAETVTLTTPATNYSVVSLALFWEAAHIHVVIRSQNPSSLIDHHIFGAEATTLMIALNKADLSSNSLQRRILNKMIADGVIQGTISGTPD